MLSAAAPRETAIRVEGLSRDFGSVRALDDLSLEVKAGTIFGFLGPNGAGKTTTLRTLVDLQRASAGEARVLGREVRAGGGALRRSIGYLQGDLALFPALRGTETLDLFARLQGRSPAARDEVLDRLGFPRAALSRRVRTYSTGMRQMIGIAAAFQHEPDVLILDEPTSGLDPMVRDAFLALVREAPARGATVLLSSHVLAEVEACADRVGFIHRGRLRLVETLEEMRRSRPRRVTLRYADGREERTLHVGDPATLLSEIDRGGLIDVEIRPVGLDEVVKDVIEREDQA